MEMLPLPNITFVNAYGAQPIERIKKAEPMEFPFMKVLLPATPGYIFPAITEPDRNTSISIAKK